MRKHLAILSGSLALLGANLALANPTLTKSEYEIAVEQSYHEPSAKQRFGTATAKQEASQERFEGTAARGTNPAVRPHTVANPERLFNLNP
jgi:hypothetical protein